MARTKVTIQEAARRLGIREDAVRKRVRRGSLPSAKEESGRVYVYLDDDLDNDQATRPAEGGAMAELRAHNATLQEQLAAERRANEENRRIIAALTQRIPELEAPAPTERGPESPESGATGSEGAETRSSTTGPERPAERRSWWREFFGFGND